MGDCWTRTACQRAALSPHFSHRQGDLDAAAGTGPGAYLAAVSADNLPDDGASQPGTRRVGVALRNPFVTHWITTR